MRVALELEFPDEQAASVMRQLRSVPKMTVRFLGTEEPAPHLEQVVHAPLSVREQHELLDEIAGSWRQDDDEDDLSGQLQAKKFVIACKENLQRVIESVGTVSEENDKLQTLLSELAKMYDNSSYPDVYGKAIGFSRNNKFVEANLCYRAFFQDHKLHDLRSIDLYLKCVFLADNVNNIHHGLEMIFLTMSELEKYVINQSKFEAVLKINCIYQYSDLHKLTHKMKFGEYAGKLVSDVLKKNPDYLLRCIINIDSFLVDNKILTDKYLLKSELYAKAVTANLLKNSIAGFWESSLEDEADNESEIARNYDWEQETFDALTDGQLGDWEDFDGDIDDARTSMGYD